jgi:hypothetical protein
MSTEQNGFFDFGGFSAEDFSPVKIEAPEKPLDEMTGAELRNELVMRRIQVRKEKNWQEEVGYHDESRLIALADLYCEAQEYYARFDREFRHRIAGDDYVPVLILGNRRW